MAAGKLRVFATPLSAESIAVRNTARSRFVHAFGRACGERTFFDGLSVFRTQRFFMLLQSVLRDRLSQAKGRRYVRKTHGRLTNAEVMVLIGTPEYFERHTKLLEKVIGGISNPADLLRIALLMLVASVFVFGLS